MCDNSLRKTSEPQKLRGLNRLFFLFQLGRTPIIFAILGDNPDCVEALLQQGARPDLVDNIGRNALHWATFLGTVIPCYPLVCYSRFLLYKAFKLIFFS